jgi:GNAT superfamily N-acetyltransferase
MVVFYCDLTAQGSRTAECPRSIAIEKNQSEGALSAQDMQQVLNCWNAKLTRRNIGQRFNRGACLWTIKSAGSLAGYGWTIKGHTIEPHYIPFGRDDVHFFDFYVFPKYRGHGLNPLLVTYILYNLIAEGSGRAFIEAAEWNRQQLSSLGKTPFRRLGRANKMTVFGRTIVCWAIT